VIYLISKYNICFSILGTFTQVSNWVHNFLKCSMARLLLFLHAVQIKFVTFYLFSIAISLICLLKNSLIRKSFLLWCNLFRLSILNKSFLCYILRIIISNISACIVRFFSSQDFFLFFQPIILGKRIQHFISSNHHPPWRRRRNQWIPPKVPCQILHQKVDYFNLHK